MTLPEEQPEAITFPSADVLLGKLNAAEVISPENPYNEFHIQFASSLATKQVYPIGFVLSFIQTSTDFLRPYWEEGNHDVHALLYKGLSEDYDMRKLTEALIEEQEFREPIVNLWELARRHIIEQRNSD